MKKFLNSGGGEAAYKRVVIHFDERLNQRRAKNSSLVAHLHRVTAKLLTKESGSAVAPDNSIYWAALLIAWDERLLRGPFAVALDGLCRAYRASPSQLVAQQTLDGSWGVIARHIAVLQTKACRKRPELQQLMNALAKRIGILSQVEDVPWLGRLGRMFEKQVRPGRQNLDKLLATNDWGHNGTIMLRATPRSFRERGVAMNADWCSRDRPLSFEAVLGQPLVVEALARRVRAGDVRHHIALEGPSGVGKRTLARLYAQALMCEAPLPSGSPCSKCDSCESILAGNPLNFVPFDAREHSSVEIARKLVDKARYVPLGVKRRSILIWNAEACEDAALDVLLKTLEERIPTVFIFTTTNWSRLRPAILIRLP